MLSPTIPRFLTCVANIQVLRSNDHHINPSFFSYLVAAWRLVRLIHPAGAYHDSIFVSPRGGFRLHCQAILLLPIPNIVKGILRRKMASNPSHRLPIIIDHCMLSCRSSGNADCKLVYMGLHPHFGNGYDLFKSHSYSHNGPFGRYHNRCTRNRVPDRQ